MGVKAQERWTCDICDHSSTDDKDKKKWVKFDIEDSHLFHDRCWHTKVICASCLECIDSARKRGQP